MLRRLGLGLITSATAVMLAGCPWVTTDFSTGLRVGAREQLIGMQGTDYPVPFVEVDGQTYGTSGPNSQGQTPAYVGHTGPGGYFDIPDAVTDTTWDNHFDYSGVIPGCGRAERTTYIPASGGQVFCTCEL